MIFRRSTGLNLLLHTRSTGGGGAERVFLTLANGLASRGHRVVLAVDQIEEDSLIDQRVEVVVVGLSNFKSIFRLARAVKKQKFDVIVGGLALSNVKLTIAKALAFSRVPLVFSYHGFSEYRTGIVSAIGYYGLFILQKAASRVVCVSELLRETIISRWKVPESKTILVYNPVSVTCLEERTPKLISVQWPETPTFVIGVVARLTEEKGVDILIAALALLKTPGVCLLIGGDGPELFRLNGQAKRLGIGARVKFLGQVSNSSVIFSQVDLAVVPSRTEAFGMTIVEALAHGLPIVATDSGGPREILADGKYGRLVPTGDPVALAAAIDEALEEAVDEAEQKHRARDFSEEVGIDQWERVLDGIVASRNALRKSSS